MFLSDQLWAYKNCNWVILLRMLTELKTNKMIQTEATVYGSICVVTSPSRWSNTCLNVSQQIDCGTVWTLMCLQPNYLTERFLIIMIMITIICLFEQHLVTKCLTTNVKTQQKNTP